MSKFQEIGEGREACVLQSMGSQRVGHDLVTGQHSCVDHVSPLLLV